MSPYSRRMEALPLAWKALSDIQRDAASRVSGWLLDALAAIPGTPYRQDGPAPRTGCLLSPVLDRGRRTQLAFIDGDRGTGKSSVLLTLMELTSAAEYALDRPPGYTEERYRELISPIEKLRAQGCRIIWLETLDMEPLSRGTNLLAAILARIAQVVDAVLRDRPPIASALADPGCDADVVGRLQQLQNDAAIVWERIDGGIHGGDPQTRALWVTQAETAGLDLHRRISEVLDGIAGILRKGNGLDPLFVLPVDDFDLAPTHCLELLRLIRMVTTPRLFFLVAGNTRIAESVLKLRTEGDLIRLAHGKPSSVGEVRDRAVEIALNNMRKLVPPGQRARLANLRIAEALAFGQDMNGGDLKSRLRALRFETNQAPTGAAYISLLGFFLLDESYGDGGSMSAEWLAGTPRQVLDCRELFAELERPDPDAAMTYQDGDRLLARVLEEIQRQVSEDWRLPYSERERLAEMLDTSVRIGIDFESLIRVEQEHTRGILLKELEYGVLLRFSPTAVRMFVPLDRETVSYRERSENQEPRLEVPRRLAAGMMFAHDLAVTLWGGYLRHSALTYKTDAGPKVECRWGSGSSRIPTVIWPTPEWWGFREFERFDRHWNLHLDKCGGDFGSAWLAAIIEVVLDQGCVPGPRGLAPKRLAELADKLAQETPVRGARHVIRRSTLVAIGLLLAPESASDLQPTMFLGKKLRVLKAMLDPNVCDLIRAARARAYRKAMNRDTRLTPQAAALCAAIAPAVFWKRLEPTVRTALDSRGRLGADDLMSHAGVLVDLANPIDPQSLNDLLVQLRKIRSAIDEGPDTDPADAELDQVISLVEASIKSYPFNELEGGAFVPTEEDIERAR
jgi:hypothetical protein